MRRVGAAVRRPRTPRSHPLTWFAGAAAVPRASHRRPGADLVGDADRLDGELGTALPGGADGLDRGGAGRRARGRRPGRRGGAAHHPGRRRAGPRTRRPLGGAERRGRRDRPARTASLRDVHRALGADDPGRDARRPGGGRRGARRSREQLARGRRPHGRGAPARGGDGLVAVERHRSRHGRADASGLRAHGRGRRGGVPDAGAGRPPRRPATAARLQRAPPRCGSMVPGDRLVPAAGGGGRRGRRRPRAGRSRRPGAVRRPDQPRRVPPRASGRSAGTSRWARRRSATAAPRRQYATAARDTADRWGWVGLRFLAGRDATGWSSEARARRPERVIVPMLRA